MPDFVKCITINGMADSEWYKVGQIYPVYSTEEENIFNILDSEGYHEWDKQMVWNYFEPSTKEAWLLQEAKRKYPIGAVVWSLGGSGKQRIMSSNFKFRCSDRLSIEHHSDCLVYKNGKWAEIIKEPLFTTEDGENIYDGDGYFTVDKNYKITFSVAKPEYIYFRTIARFSTLKAAEEYIAKHKEKTLEDYENTLIYKNIGNLDKSSHYNGFTHNITKNLFYRLLKENEPKLYWTKVLQLIADDLNQEFGLRQWVIELYDDGYNIDSYTYFSFGAIKFSHKEAAVKASKIMGDKLDYIYKQ
jgi:hypothetical protein